MTARNLTLFVTTLALAANSAIAGDTVLFRHESGFLRGSDFQLNAEWLVANHGRMQYQAYALWRSDTGGYFSELNFALGPSVKLPHATVYFPLGLRLHPEESWRVSHGITKANVFGRAGNFPFFAINDLSWALGGRGKNEHFLQQQFAWQPSGERFGLGFQSEQVLAGSRAVSTKLGPVVKLTYAKNEHWAWTVDIAPFRDTTKRDWGVKINFLTFHFGR
jgi:hypothetical protein